MGLGIFLRDWNDFAAKTEFGIVLECYCKVEVALRIFLREKKRRAVGLIIVLSEKRKGERELNLDQFVQVKGRSKLKQVRRGVGRPVR